MSWWEDWNNHGKPPAPQVHEKEDKVVLYHGKPLMRDRRVGFRPPGVSSRDVARNAIDKEVTHG